MDGCWGDLKGRVWGAFLGGSRGAFTEGRLWSAFTGGAYGRPYGRSLRAALLAAFTGGGDY